MVKGALPARRTIAIGRERWSVLGPCALCGVFEGRGFYYCRDFSDDAYPEYGFCSVTCMEGGSALTAQNGTLPRLTDMELQAIKETRPVLYEALVVLGKQAQFDSW